LNALKNDIVYLPDYTIEEVSSYFPILKEDMLCYTRKSIVCQNWLRLNKKQVMIEVLMLMQIQ